MPPLHRTWQHNLGLNYMSIWDVWGLCVVLSYRLRTGIRWNPKSENRVLSGWTNGRDGV